MRGERTINEDQATIARRVFRDFASGVSPRAIAQASTPRASPARNGAR